MTQEKVLWFLGLEEKQKIDKYAMKFSFWFDFIVTVFIIVCGLLLDVIPITFLNIVLLNGLIFLDVIFFIYLKLIRNPGYLYTYSFVVLITTTIKLLYGFLVFSQAELIKDRYPIITWVHIAVLVFTVLVAIFLLVRFYLVWQGLKENTIEHIAAKIHKQNKKSKWKRVITILGASSPMVFVRLFSDDLENMGLGMGFGFWLLACCFLLIACLFIPKFIISIKYRAFVWFQN